MMINFHSMEYHFQWHLSQCSDILEAGLYAVSFIAEAISLLSIQNIRPPLGTSGLLFSGCCGSFPALKQLMHEADHLSLFSAEVTDQCSCNCAFPNVFMVYTETSLPLTIVLDK
jgi:hypothetical protein